MKPIIYLLVGSVVIAQDIPKRPAVPSATTLASPTSQIAAWYRWAVYQETLLAECRASASATPAPRVPPVTVTITNSRVTLTATADGTPPISFQWLKDGVDLPGATTSTITVPSGTAAAYAVRATNTAGSAVSTTIAVTAP